ncbi:MAG: DNA integrity scanning protein DisA [Tissierellia bacterium]|nr:DNA integrity scanning protein DisA [Tissierellia bacterium]
MEMDLYDTLKMVAPGTHLRMGLDYIIRANTGALIVVGNTKEVRDIAHGGFYIDCEYTPSNIYELAKIDGAIILNINLNRILYANVQLFPCQHIASKETGTRHKTAERVAKQTGVLVIAISKRRKIITLYKRNYQYVLKDTNEILNKANQAIQTLEKYRDTLDRTIEELTILEFENSVRLHDVANAIQKMEMVWRIGNEMDMYISELGIEGRLLNMQVVELMDGIEADRLHLIRDYLKEGKSDCHLVEDGLRHLDDKELLNLNTIANLLGYGKGAEALDYRVMPKGYRILSRIPRIPTNILENVISKFSTFQNLISASYDQLNSVEGIGETRAMNIIEGLSRYHD